MSQFEVIYCDYGFQNCNSSVIIVPRLNTVHSSIGLMNIQDAMDAKRYFRHGFH